ncbi:MAG: VWA domain-containing protein [Eubacterium sp.]|nr:VWA domain-containing protein [Eubacterium sp.]
MGKWMKIGAAVLSMALVAPSTSMAAVTPSRGKVQYENRTGNYSDAEEKEYTRTETTIVKVEDEITDTTTSTTTKDIIEPADIVFVVDSTGSMGPHIQNVKTNVEKFSEYLESKGVGARMAVVEYKYIISDGKDSTKIHTVDGSPWHKTTSELKKTLDIIKSGIGGGIGVNEESLVDALGFVANGDLKFREDAHKFAIVLTDEGFKEDNRHGYTTDTLIQALQSNNINTSVITENGLQSFFEKMIGSTGIIADIQSSDFYGELEKLADVIFKTITEEVVNKNVKPVESVTVTSKGDSAIKIGNSVTLTARVMPENATEKKVSWVVDDDSIVELTISGDTRSCKVTGKKKGSVNITAVTDDGGFTGNYKVKVIDGKTSGGSNNNSNNGNTNSGGVTINRGDQNGGNGGESSSVVISVDDIAVYPAKKTISKGSKFQIKLTADADSDISQEEFDKMVEESVDSITYRSTKSSVASVNKKTGVVTGKKKGTAEIRTTVYTADGKSRTYKTKVYVKN